LKAKLNHWKIRVGPDKTEEQLRAAIFWTQGEFKILFG
jgi:hypothetical protein